MTIALTTPYDPGDLDPGQSYTHVRILRAVIDNTVPQVELTIVRGFLSGPDFVPGRASPERVVIKDRPRQGGTDYADEEAKKPFAGANTYAAYDRQLHEFLIVKALFPGTIV